jgi:glycosyltransferase involved in cell wall biosynthesis
MSFAGRRWMNPSVSLVIPGRNAEETVGACLGSVLPLLESRALSEILFVDDASTDGTARILRELPVGLLAGEGRGPGAARNLGWRSARGELVWFVDADCVAEPDALERLLPHLGGEEVAAAGGSYGNMRPEALLSSLIQEEIVERHRRMATDARFLASFNLLCRRDALRAAGGFDERFLKAQDAELAYRLVEMGYRLRFEPRSRVKHFHPTRLDSYLTTQARQGYWRVRLYEAHPSRLGGDGYSGPLDHVQPPLALLCVGLLALAPFAPWRLGAGVCLLLLVGAQIPMTVRLLVRTRRARFLAFLPFGFLRAFARAAGLAVGLLDVLLTRRRFAAGSPGA